jgi:hypothetical protein
VPLYVVALVLHGAIGGLDVFINHEWLARLPTQRRAVPEEWLHGARELLFCLVFLSLGWFEWHGAAAWWIFLLYAGEIAVSAVDVVVEGDIRVLPRPERVLHLFLFMNLGALVVLVGQALLGWSALPAAVVPVDHGWASRVLTVMGVGALAWAVRDVASAVRMKRAR